MADGILTPICTFVFLSYFSALKFSKMKSGKLWR